MAGREIAMWEILEVLRRVHRAEAAEVPGVDARRLPNPIWSALLDVSCSASLSGVAQCET